MRARLILVLALSTVFAGCVSEVAELDGGDAVGKADRDDAPAPPPPFLVIGHRGAPYTAVENTVPSLSAALQEGANSVEIDLCVTADGHVVVWHDADPDGVVALVRQTGAEGLPHIPDVPGLDDPYRAPVRDLTLAELREHYGYAANTGFFDNVFDAERIGAHIPTLREVAEWTRTDEARGLHSVFLDVKLGADDVDLVPVLRDELVELFGDAPYVVYTLSPVEPVVVALRDALEEPAPALRSGVVYDFEKNGALDASRRLGLTTVSTGKTLLRSWNGYVDELTAVLDGADAPGQPRIDSVVVWTFDDPQQMQTLVDLGVDGIMTNRPATLARLVGTR